MPLLTALVIVAIAIALDVGLPHTSVLWHWVEGVIAGVALGWLGLRCLRWSQNHLRLTSLRLMRTWGVVRHHHFETLLGRIEEIHVRQRGFERVLGTGRLEVALWGEPDQWILEYVRRPEVFQRLTHRRIPPGGAT